MYTVALADLTAVLTEAIPRRLVEPSRRIAELVILDIPTGNSFRLRLGDERNQFFTVSRPFSMEPVGDDESNGGLWLANPVAQAGIVVEILIVWGDGRTSQLNAVT